MKYLLTHAGVRSEEFLADRKLQFIRRKINGGEYYFITNDGNTAFNDWVLLNTPLQQAVLFDPMLQRSGVARTRKGDNNTLDIFLQLDPGESCIVQTGSTKFSGAKFPYTETVGEAITLDGKWDLTFLSGGPVLPKASEVSQLQSWTDLPVAGVKEFSGTAEYSIDFEKPVENADAFILSLGTVKESAEIILNGRKIATLIGPTYSVDIPAALLRKENRLQVIVTNGMANRIIDLDKRGVPWKKFYNVNMPARLAENRGEDGLFTSVKWEPRALRFIRSGEDHPGKIYQIMVIQDRLTICLMKRTIVFFVCFLFAKGINAQAGIAPKPLFDDPVYHGAADPVIIYNKQKKIWWMLYTNRRASIDDSTVQWVHGTRIGIAESKDGSDWKYIDTANINYRPDDGYTHWAPDVIEHNGIYHMYLTYVPGVFKDWDHPREILHLTSNDLLNWKYESTLKLVNQKVIDASVFKLPDGTWRMWYNNEPDGKSIYYADSKDLYNWVDKGKAIAARGEGPKVFWFKNKYWMIVDVWKGMELYYSDDLLKWTKQPKRILEEPGKGIDDQAIGGHCDVVVNNDRAYVFYFTHPGRRKDNPAAKSSFDDKRSVIQLAELKV